MMQVEEVLAESSGVLLLESVEIEVMLGNGGCNGHTLNRWHMRIWFATLCLLVLGG
jgi:hypothetical protein